MALRSHLYFKIATIGGGALALASCNTAPPVLTPTVAATPPLTNVPPPRPVTPFGASLSTPIPPRGPTGLRQTINRDLSPEQSLWNLRSAWNVAALNCSGPRYANISIAYRAFLENNVTELAAANIALDNAYRQEHGSSGRALRDQYTTQVYNYFALPPARTYFCEQTLALANRYLNAPPEGLDGYAQAELPLIENAFERFYSEFERFEVDVVNWDANYAAEYGYLPGGYANPLPQAEPETSAPPTETTE